MRRVLAGFAAVVAVGLVSAPSAQACSCAEDPDVPPETIDGYDAAVTARLVDVFRVSGDRQRLVYEVLRAYKGNLEEGDEFKQTNDLRSSCSIPSRQGKRYGLRLNRWRGKLQASPCAKFGPESLRRAAKRSGNARSGAANCAATA